ncbi:MAG TPA: ubiquinone/menaquinone biosynthesis methyltransferase [Thermoanaerobaculia bacterium]|nr:ubiquinone/menaquinone biosynthesis methyltransferase [Thermoanaerobaculia bacterium]
MTVLDKSPKTIAEMFARIAPRYDRANRVLSFRIDVAWRRKVAKRFQGLDGPILDLASGTGDLALALRENERAIVAADLTFEMLLEARRKFATGNARIPLVVADALHLPFRTGAFEGIVIAFGIRNFSDPVEGLIDIRRTLNTHGLLGVLEFSRPALPVRFFYEGYSRFVLPLVGGMITGARSAYSYLQRSSSTFPDGKRFLGMMQAAGFGETRAKRLTFGIVTFYTGRKP